MRGEHVRRADGKSNDDATSNSGCDRHEPVVVAGLRSRANDEDPAGTLGLALPQAMLMRADAVIQ
jgi:hypothetical protein